MSSNLETGREDLIYSTSGTSPLSTRYKPDLLTYPNHLGNYAIYSCVSPFALSYRFRTILIGHPLAKYFPTKPSRALSQTIITKVTYNLTNFQGKVVLM